MLTSLSLRAVLAANVGAEGAWLIAEEGGRGIELPQFLWLCRDLPGFCPEPSRTPFAKHGCAVWVLLPSASKINTTGAQHQIKYMLLYPFDKQTHDRFSCSCRVFHQALFFSKGFEHASLRFEDDDSVISRCDSNFYHE